MKPFLRIAAVLFTLALIVGAAFYWNPLWFNDQLIHYRLWHSDVHSEYIDAGGYRLHYYEAAPPDGSTGIPLVLIHGLGARAEDWSPMIPTLAAAGFHIYAPDLLGYGRSPKPDVAYSIPLEENVVIDFMHAAGLQHADLDGWSMGGWIAAKLALDHPGLVDRLVLDDSAGITFTPAFARTAFVPTDAASLNALIALLTPHPKPLTPFIVRASLRKLARSGKIVQQTMDSMESGHDLLDTQLANITQPTLLVWGAEDKLIPIAVGEAMHRDIANSTLVPIPGCGHLAPSQCAKPVLAATIQFLKPQAAPGLSPR